VNIYGKEEKRKNDKREKEFQNYLGFMVIKDEAILRRFVNIS